MKAQKIYILAITVVIILIYTSGCIVNECVNHYDKNADGFCDICYKQIIINENTSKCLNCKNIINNESLFCEFCGFDLSTQKICNNCGVVTTYDKKFCYICGDTLAILCNHLWIEATCKIPSTCKKCGETQGEPLDHKWIYDDNNNFKCCDMCELKIYNDVKYIVKYTAETTTNMDGTNQAAILGLDATLFSAVGDKNGNNNNVGLNKDGTIRVYHDGGNGACQLTVSINDGVIKQIVITATHNGDAIQVLVNGVEVEGVNGIYNINAASFTITNKGTAQARMSQIEIIA